MSVSVALRHDFGGFSADLAFEAPPGVTVLFGPSGSGKSTVLNAVAGLLRPDQARITIGETVLTDTATRIFLHPHRRRLGIIFQDGRLFPHLNVRQNLRYGRWFAPRGARSPEVSVIEMLGIGALLDRAPATLSGGERQRVAIGRALLSEPRLILADEPLSALDEDRKAEILPYLERLRDELRVPMLYVSHAPAEVARIATTVAMLEAGRIARIGPAAEVLADPAFAGRGREAGAVIVARVVTHHPDGVTELQAGGLPRVPPSPPPPPRRPPGAVPADPARHPRRPAAAAHRGSRCDAGPRAARGHFGAEPAARHRRDAARGGRGGAGAPGHPRRADPVARHAPLGPAAWHIARRGADGDRQIPVARPRGRGHPNPRKGDNPMKLSARNRIKGTVEAITRGAVTSHVVIDIGGAKITSSITNEAVDDLALARGDAVYAVIKASDVMVGKD
mgnify:CR=1 FL=1